MAEQAFDDLAMDVQPATFRLNAKNLFLTYPHCPGEPDALRDHLLQQLGAATVVYMCIARELHADGTPHLHAFVGCNTAVNIRSADRLDFDGHHGNYQSTRSPKNVIRYVKKDDQFIEYGTMDPRWMSPDDRKSILAAVKRQKTECDLMAYIFTNDLTRSHNTLVRFWQSNLEQRVSQPRFTLESFRHIPLHLDLCLNALDTSDKALAIIGPTGCGKTQYLLARFAERLLRVTHVEDLKKRGPDQTLILFDDMELGHLPRTAVLHLLDVKTDRTLHARYSNITLTSNLSFIFVANSKQLLLGSHLDDPAICRRIEFCELPDNVTRFYAYLPSPFPLSPPL